MDKTKTNSSFSLKTDKPGWLSNMFARLLRVHDEFQVGQEYPGKNFNAVIIETTPDKKDVIEVRFNFKSVIVSDGIIFIYYNVGKFNEWKFNEQNQDKWLFIGDSSDIFESLS